MANQNRAPAGPLIAIEQLRDATNAHDLDAVVACFHRDVHSQQPLHPSRTFRGNENIRQNWAMIFGGVPDLHADLLRTATSGKIGWAEWHWSGTSRDRKAFEMRGITVMEVEEGLISAVSLYMEPVEVGGEGNLSAIRKTIGASR